MTATTNFLAVDLGASNGRVLLGRWDGNRFALQELHRFANGPVSVAGHIHWDVLRVWDEIKTGLCKYTTQIGGPLAGIGVDTWGVDFGLLDKNGRLLGNPYHYRDVRTDGVPDIMHTQVPYSRMFQTTGIQLMSINTVYQLYSMTLSHEPQLAAADMMLMMPDLFHYWLTGRKAGEYTITSTSEMLDSRTRQWATELIAELGIPTHILPPLVAPGTILDNLRPDIMAEAGFQQAVPVIATGSHDTANAVAAVPRPGRRERLSQQRHLELDGRRAARAGHQRGIARLQRNQRGRRRQDDPPAQGTSPACGCCRSVVASGNTRDTTIPGTICWRWPARPLLSATWLTPTRRTS